MFIISYGIMFTIAPMIIGSVYNVVETSFGDTMSTEWIEVYNQTKDTTQYLIPLIPSIGIFILIIKVLMVASARGRD
jgi:hypothetical protein